MIFARFGRAKGLKNGTVSTAWTSQQTKNEIPLVRDFLYGLLLFSQFPIFFFCKQNHVIRSIEKQNMPSGTPRLPFFRARPVFIIVKVLFLRKLGPRGSGVI